ncbi:hypothetical protein [Nocardiopsis sp. NPDC006938]|uniref:hypothetical protein n=1 Tax=Nocardiopsis sp. NPDC006938 TaxID=3364337 RepID=UPI0036CA97B9
MNPSERFARLHDGVRFSIENTDNAYYLPPLVHRELRGWVLREGRSRRESVDSCDTPGDLDGATGGLVELADTYRKLCRELFYGLELMTGTHFAMVSRDAADPPSASASAGPA